MAGTWPAEGDGGFNPGNNQNITGQWTFLLDAGKTFLVSDDPTLVASTIYFGAFNDPVFAPNYIGLRVLYSDAGSGKAMGSYGDYDTANDSATYVIGTVNNGSAGGTDTLSVSASNFVSRVMSHQAIKGVFPLYANLAAINAAIASPEANMYVMVTGQGLAWYSGAAWVKASDATTAIT